MSTPRSFFFAVLATALLAIGLSPTPATASEVPPATAPTNIKAVSTSRSAIALAWDAVPGATSYKVTYSTSSKMKKPKSKTTTKPWVDLTKLSAKKTYYVTIQATVARVLAPTGTGGTGATAVGPATQVSKKVKVKTKSKSAAYTYLAPAGLTVNKVDTVGATLAWASRGKGLTYRVTVSLNRSFSSAKHYYVKGTSLRLSDLADGLTYYARVGVISTKYATLSDQSAPTEFTTAKLSYTGGPATIVVGSYNIGSKSISKGGSWSARRGLVASTIRSQAPDVIGLQEASQGKLSGQNLSQAEDLVNRLGKPYALANNARYNCANPTTPHKCKAQYQGAANSQKIVYNTEKVTLLSHGSKRTSSAKTRFEEHRYVEWATFRHKETGRTFFFVNVHLDPGSGSKNLAMRKKQTEQVLAAIRTNNPNQLPAYVVGDFNSHKWTSPKNEPYDMMLKEGFVDPLGNYYLSTKDTKGAIVGKRINTHYSSHNAWKRDANVKPTWVNGIYLDYIFTSAGIEVPEWETVVKVDTAGKLVGQIPSDHNMLRATTVLR